MDLTTLDPASTATEEESQKIIDQLIQYYKDHPTDVSTLKASPSATTIQSVDSINGSLVNGISVSKAALLDDPTGAKGASMPKQFYILFR